MSSDKEDHYTERSPNTNAFHLASLSTISLIHLARDEGLALSILFVEALILVGLAYLLFPKELLGLESVKQNFTCKDCSGWCAC